jgi:hypothetical protein
MVDPNYRPCTLGRFNYLTLIPDVFEVLYKPIEGDTYIKIAKNLTFKQATDLMDDLNEVIDEHREGYKRC